MVDVLVCVGRALYATRLSSLNPYFPPPPCQIRKPLEMSCLHVQKLIVNEEVHTERKTAFETVTRTYTRSSKSKMHH
jgi:hypothetical protein